MLTQKLAEGIVEVRVDLGPLQAAMPKIRTMLAGAGGGAGSGGGVASGIATGVASGMAAGVARGSAQARNALGQFASQGVATGVASGMAAGVARGRAGVSAPLTQAVARATAAGMTQGIADASGRMRDARGRFTGGGGGAGGGGAAGRAGMGLLQGLGLGGIAFSPEQMVGRMIGGGLKDAVTNAMDLEATFVGLQRVSGESAANVEKFKRTIFDIGKAQAGVSISDLTTMSMAGAKAGITDKEGLSGLETFTRGLAKVRNSVQGIGTEQLADDMTRILNLFHKGTDYVQSFGSVLARMDNVSTSSAADILDMSKSLSGTFTSLGMTIPQVMAFSSVLSDVGLTNQQGASSFSQILRMMASNSEEMAKKIGVPVEKFQHAVRTDAMGALGMLIGKFRELNNVDPIKAQEFLSELGFKGVKTAGALQQLSSMFEQVQERTAMAVEEETNLGALQAANNLNSTTALGNLQKLKNAFEELGDAIGSKLVGPLTEASKVSLTLINGLGKEKGKGGPEGGSTNPLSLMEGVEFTMMNVVASIGGAIPDDPAFKAKLNDYKQRIEASFGAGDGKALAAGAAGAAEALPPKMAGPEAAAGEGGAPGRGALFGKRDAFFAAADAAGAPAPADEVKKAKEKAGPKAETARFSSQMFSDPADFARSAIQTALGDSPAKEMVKRQEETNLHLRTLNDKVGHPSSAGPRGARREPVILTGDS